MKKIRVLLLAASALLLVQTAVQAASSSLLVIPARYRVVKLAFDVARMRDVTIVSYRSAGAAAEPLLFVWNGAKWDAISLEQYRSGSFASQPPAQVILVGSDKDVPAALRDQSPTADVKRIQQIDVATVATELDSVFKFKAPEWQTLAQRNELKIEDVNTERRHYGRYGKPGEQAKPPMPGAVPSATTKATHVIQGVTLPPSATVSAADKKTAAHASKSLQTMDPIIEEQALGGQNAAKTVPADDPPAAISAAPVAVRMTPVAAPVAPVAVQAAPVVVPMAPSAVRIVTPAPSNTIAPTNVIGVAPVVPANK